MYIKSIEAQKFTIAGGTEGLLFPPHPKGEQQIAIVEMDGVYPAIGYSINDYCTETMIVVEGEVEIEYDDQWTTLRVNDIFMILPNHRYRMRGKGKTIVAISPQWDSKQNRIIDEQGNELPK